MTADSEQMDVSTIHQLLSDFARRTIIYRLGLHDDAEPLTARELAENIASVKDGDEQHWYATLRHRHLPKLEVHEGIEWDQTTGTVESGKYTELLFDYLTEVERIQGDLP